MRPNANIIKTYWQAMDKDGRAFLHNERPPLKHGFFQCTENGDCTSVMLFPIPLKPLQIAEIKVCENGTWSYEIEREEGWYMAKGRSGAEYLALYKNGEYTHYHCKETIDISLYTISSVRIPDECII